MCVCARMRVRAFVTRVCVNICFIQLYAQTVNTKYKHKSHILVRAPTYVHTYIHVGKDPINKWVDDSTNHMIKKLLDKDPPGPAVLMNAVYFKGVCVCVCVCALLCL